MSKKNILVVSVDLRETRVALIEDGIIAELHIERGGTKSSTTGNVYLGKVTRVLPGLQAAFIDIGQERAAFLHVEDLIRPDDFESYLAGGRKSSSPGTHDNEPILPELAEQEEFIQPSDESLAELPSSEASATSLSVLDPSTNALEERASQTSSPSLDVEAEPSSIVLSPSDSNTEVVSPASSSSPNPLFHEQTAFIHGVETLTEPSQHKSLKLPAQETLLISDPLDHGFEERESEELSILSSEPNPQKVVLEEEALEEKIDSEELPEMPSFSESEESEDFDLDLTNMPGFTISDPGDPVPRAPNPNRGNSRDFRSGNDRNRRRGRNTPSSGDRQNRNFNPNAPSRNYDQKFARKPENKLQSNRISKTTPIREVVKEGQEIIVQVSKDPIGTKGARCTSHVSLPGRYVVYLPTVDHVGVSKRIGSDRERARLKEVIETLKPEKGGIIVRTASEGLTKKQLKQDVGYLVHLWGEIAKKKEGSSAPQMLSSELDLVLKVARDLFTDEVGQLVVDDKSQYDRICRFLEMFAPERLKDVAYYSGHEPIFDAYGIEDEIQRALARKVPLPSGGYLIIDQAEALTAIDVNTGRFVGKGSKDMEETILKTNLEAVNEIAYQLRFRNIGGLIILDLIDMERSSNREKVRRTLEELLQKDKAKTTLNRISDLGLIEMTRKRTRESLGRLMHEPCFYCDGTGQLQSKETIAFEILREVRRKHADLPGYTIQVSAHPAVADLLNGTEKNALAEAENRYMRKILVVPRKDYHLEQFDIQGK